jgi:hypothetical protein
MTVSLECRHQALMPAGENAARLRGTGWMEHSALAWARAGG